MGVVAGNGTWKGDFPYNVTFDPGLDRGSRPCRVPPLFSYDANSSCLAGCCINSSCVCREGYSGDLCEYELQCATARDGLESGFESGFSTGGCETASADGSVHCTCHELGFVAVIRFRPPPPPHPIEQ